MTCEGVVDSKASYKYIDIRGETNERKFKYSFENRLGEQTDSHIHIRTAKSNLYMHMTVRFLGPISCGSKALYPGLQKMCISTECEDAELATAPSVHALGWGTCVSAVHAHVHSHHRSTCRVIVLHRSTCRVTIDLRAESP